MTDVNPLTDFDDVERHLGDLLETENIILTYAAWMAHYTSVYNVISGLSSVEDQYILYQKVLKAFSDHKDVPRANVDLTGHICRHFNKNILPRLLEEDPSRVNPYDVMTHGPFEQPLPCKCGNECKRMSFDMSGVKYAGNCQPAR